MKREAGSLSQCLGKVRYHSEQKAARRAAQHSVKYGRPMRHYFCGMCGGYHCTSKARR